MVEGEISFGRFRLDLARHQLRRDETPVRLGSRALDILCVLASAGGKVVTKDELMARVWAGVVVEEHNIQVHISALRRAFEEYGAGESWIMTVPGRGYRFLPPREPPPVGDSPPRQSVPVPDRPSLAVLPFQNLSGDPEQEYFADGMVEEIITALSRIRWLFVTARNSSFTYKGQNVDVERVGRELGVRYVLEGSVRKSANRVRITAQLIDAGTGAHLWADRVDGALEDVFELQDKVASSVAGVIEPALQAAETARSTARPTADLTAYDLYLRAHAMVWSSARKIPEALGLFEQAIARDPRFGPALAWAAFCCFRLVLDGRSDAPAADRLKGTDFARRALEVAGDDPGTLANAAQALAFFGEDIDAMMALVDRALALNPNFARGWHTSASLRLNAGQPDIAIAHVEAALRLSPGARVGTSLTVIGAAHFLARRLDEAVPKLLLAIQEDPSFPVPYRYLAACYAHMGRLAEAQEIVRRLRAITSIVIPDASHLRNVEHRELILSGLRLATGETRIRSGDDSERAGLRATVPSARPVRTLTNLLEPVTQLIGREAELAEVTDLVTTQRLVTLIGEGGIGKTRLALEAVRQLLPEFPDGVWVAQLAPLSDPELVPATAAAALGLDFTAGEMSTEHVANALGAKQLMLVLDNCEHVIAAAAAMAEAVLHANSAIRVLATSREPLRIEGECLYRVPPLAVPAEVTEDAERLLRHGAVRLFVARARAADPHFSPGGRNAAVVAGICRRLDGIPLAIELAAARGGVLGIQEIAARLDDRFNLLTGGHRTAMPRHQTLRATLDWSHDLLSESEQVVLRRLAIFAGAFSLTAATAVLASAGIAATDVVDGIANLVMKSLVRADLGEGPTQYRLLETTRAYALEKLSESGEIDAIARRHAKYYLDLFERAEAESETRPTAEWLAVYGSHIDNVRAALDWAVSPGGDAFVGVALTAASVPLWLQLSMLNECRLRVERALAGLGPTGDRNARLQMKLNAALGLSLMQLEGPRLADALWTKALGLAESVDDPEYQLRALWGLWACRLSAGDYGTTVPLAQRFCSLAASLADPADQLIGDRMMGILLHHRGDQAQARDYLDRVRDRYIAPARRSHTVRFQFEHQVMASVTLARILWLQGFPDRAVQTAQSSADQVGAIDHRLSLCRALAHAVCPTALFLGDLPMAERAVAMLLDESARHGLTVYQLRGRCLEGALQIKRGDAIGGLRRIRDALDELRRTGFVLGYMVLPFTVVEGLVATGQVRQAIAAIDEALDHSERTEERWCVAEFLRTKGELLLMEGEQPGATRAENCFLHALDVARRQGALSWELRAATSLARLWRDRGRTKEALELLTRPYEQFTEGFETTDLKAAKRLVDDLRQQ